MLFVTDPEYQKIEQVAKMLVNEETMLYNSYLVVNGIKDFSIEKNLCIDSPGSLIYCAEQYFKNSSIWQKCENDEKFTLITSKKDLALLIEKLQFDDKSYEVFLQLVYNAVNTNAVNKVIIDMLILNNSR